ncbi:MAG: hypothetical protein ACQESP_06570 [Candidatus Muiribacteriota bacterium]
MNCPMCGKKMRKISNINEFNHNKLECMKCTYKIFYREHHKVIKFDLF